MSSKKHIVIIVPGFPKNETDFLCAPPLQQLLLEISKSDDLQISVLALHYPYEARNYCWHGIEVTALGGNNAKGWRKLAMLQRANSFLNQLHKSQPVHGVHAFWLSDASLVGGRWSRKHGVPHFVTFMGQEAETARKYRRFVRKTDTLIALSSHQKNRIETQLQLNVQHVYPFGIQEEKGAVMERTTDILGVGALIPVKNYQQFVETVARLQSEHELKVVLIGDGPERAKLAQLAIEKKAVIEFLGIIDRAMVLQEMRKAVVFFHPSHSEGLGFVFLEALMCGAKIVSKAVGISADIQSDNWTVVEDEDLESVILRALNEKSSCAPEVPLRIADTASHYLDLWKIE